VASAVFNKGVSAHMSDDNARCEHSRGQAGVKKVVAHASDSFSITWRRARGLIPTPIALRARRHIIVITAGDPLNIQLIFISPE